MSPAKRRRDFVVVVAWFKSRVFQVCLAKQRDKTNLEEIPVLKNRDQNLSATQPTLMPCSILARQNMREDIEGMNKQLRYT